MQQTEDLETQYKTNLNKEENEVLHLSFNEKIWKTSKVPF